MLRKLDPYSQYIPDYGEFRTQNRGNYGGLGMLIGIREDMLTVVTPFKGSPAALAGLQSGDVISHIEGESTAVMTLNEAVDQLRGEPGTRSPLWLCVRTITVLLRLRSSREAFSAVASCANTSSPFSSIKVLSFS